MLRDCQIVTDKQRTQCQLTLNWNWRILPDCSKFESQNVSRHMDTSSTTEMSDILGKHRRPCGTSRTKSMRTSTCWSLVGKTVRRHVLGSWMGKKYQLGSVCLRIEHKDYFLSVHVDDINMPGKKQNMAPMWKKIDEKTLILTNQHHFLIMFSWDVLNVNANRMMLSFKNAQRCLNHVFLLEQMKNYQVRKSLTQKQ